MNEYNEIFDVVNAEDIVIGKASRAYVHKNLLMHRSVHILVFNSFGKLFLQKRSMLKDESPGLWDTSAAGHLNSGEHYLDCANRELKEELSISGVDLNEIMIIPAQVVTFWEHVRVYKCITDKKICIDENEISEGRYIDISKIKDFIQLKPSFFTPTFNYIFANYICKQC